MNFATLNKLGRLDVTDLLMASHLGERRTPRELAALLRIDRSAIRHRMNKLRTLLSDVLGEEDLVLAHQQRDGLPYEPTEVGKSFARWATSHLRLFQQQISEEIPKIRPRIQIGSVHMMMHVAALLRDRVRTRVRQMEVQLTPVTSGQVLGVIAEGVRECDCFLTPLVSHRGKLEGLPEGFAFEKISEEEICALVNAALAKTVDGRIGPEEIERWLAFQPSPGVTRAWLLCALGADGCTRLEKRGPLVRTYMNQALVLRTQAEPGLMIANKSFVEWVVNGGEPPLSKPRLPVDRSLKVRELSAELQRIRIVTGLVYDERKFEISSAFHSVLAELKSLRTELN
ncbi:MAG TPA: hypothetical protein VF669_17385 [Tepidisphaeraceae bacterium]